MSLPHTIRCASLIFLCSLITAARASAADRTMDRSGFTLELGFGAAMTFAPSEDGGATLGLEWLSLNLGGFVSPELAVTFTATATRFQSEQREISGNLVWTTREPFIQALYGVAVQLWPDETYFVGGAVGLGTYGPVIPRTAYSTDRSLDAGFGMSARAGFPFLHSKGHALALVLEGSATIILGERSVFGTALKVEWQLL